MSAWNRRKCANRNVRLGEKRLFGLNSGEAFMGVVE
jgi:hypothetical protein